MSVGYPDFSRTQAEAGNQVGSYTGQKGNDPTTGILDAIGYAYLTINVNDSGNVHNFEMVITWYSDHGATVIVNTSQFAPVPGSNVSYQIPAVSRYFQVVAQHQTFGDTEVVSGTVQGSNVSVSNAIVGPKIEPFILNSQSVGATTDANVAALYTYWGPATFFWFIGAASTAQIQLQYFSMLSASWVNMMIILLSAGQTQGAVQVDLPPNPVRVNVHNNTGAAISAIGGVTIG